MTLLWNEKINNQKMTRWLLIFLLLWVSLPLQAAEIQNIRMGHHPDKTRLVIDFTGESNFRAEVTASPWMLNITLPEKSWDGQGQLIPPVTALNASITGEFTTLSAPLSDAYIIQTAFVINGAPNRLVIDLKKVSEDEFHTTLQGVHGPLQISKSQPAIQKKPIIMIDAGHGGFDPGAVSKYGLREKNITLTLSKLIADTLNQSGKFDARLTRSTDKFIRLRDRVTIAEEARADMFISIHADSLQGLQAEGASLYTLSAEASDEETALLAQRENRADLQNPEITHAATAEVNEILFTLAMEAMQGESKQVANDMIAYLDAHNVKLLKGPLRHAGFAVLKSADMPSVLLETGFISNRQEAEQLQNHAYQIKIATALQKALERYFDL